jgi:glycosyltransferase involved in cell wall biosynthesis
MENGLINHITFLGVRENVFDYLQAGDVFYLPSREDPFPLVCLEAAQCGIPVICFEDAGGMPGFVENDAGFVIPFEDVDAAADKILFLYQNPSVLTGLGAAARKKFLQRHSIETGAPEILIFCRKVGNFLPAVSIIVPNYNCEKFLEKRMESILHQTFRDFEIIILDDASTDRSLEIIEKYLHLPNVRLIKNLSNSGSPFIQWHKGFVEAKGEIIWFAEADDLCEPEFLQKLLPYFNNPSVALAYCDSAIIDENDAVTGDYSNYYTSLDPYHWKSSYQVSGTREINYGLGIKNSIPNASAVLIRKSCVPEDFVHKSFQYKFSGDWFFYTRVLEGRQITFHAERLNYHRKHQQTVTSEFNTDKVTLLLKEAESIHCSILENYSVHTDLLQKWDYYITEQIHAFYPGAKNEEFDRYYPYTLVREKIKDAIIRSKNNRRLVFLTTNDGSSDGGSEQLWKNAAIECCRRGHEVMVVIKKWDPEPVFLKDFYNTGITVIFKEQDHFDHVRNFNPDLMIISLGDQDEGTEYYEQCKINRIPYVIVNQLTKEPKYWPVNSNINEQVKKGYLGSEIVLFTGKNNQEVMEKRINCKIHRAGIIYNPFDVDRNSRIPFPSMEKGLKIAMVGNLLRIHKGQHLAIELFQLKKWRDRQVHLNLYGKGIDESVLKMQAADYKMKNVTFHGHTNEILNVWRENHAILMPSFMEGLPLALVGAMICGRVPVVTDIGAHREVIDDNISGFIASEPTVVALDEAFERAFKRSADWKDIGQNARKAILQILPEDPVDHFISQLIPFFDKKQ